MNIFIVDDHPMILYGMKTWTETNTDFQVVGSATSIADCFSQLEKLEPKNQPDLFIVDVDLGQDSGFALVKQLKEQNKDIKILMYSMHKENGYFLEAKNSGANGYIVKDADMKDFKVCIEKIVGGEDYFSDDILEKNSELNSHIKLLTPKERLVFQEVLKEHTNNEIAKNLNLTLHSIEIYVSRIYDKLGFYNRGDLIAHYK